jgi:ribonuclease P protein component
MLRERRLRRSTDFAAVYRRGRPLSSDLLALRSLKTAGPQSRVGFAVGKRIGTAVVRNRVKRRLRAAIASLPLAPGWDLVVAARPAAATQDYRTLRSALLGLLQRARLLEQRNASAAAQGEREQA